MGGDQENEPVGRNGNGVTLYYYASIPSNLGRSPVSGSLMIMPSQAWAEPPETNQVGQVLSELGLIGEAYEEGFLVGEKFGSLITFAGCSPALMTDPDQAGDKLMTVHLLGPWEQPRLLVGRNTTKPRCPGCRARIVDWRELTETYASQPDLIHSCPQCGTQTRPVDLDWRQQAVAGRLLIEVRNVFPGEVVPTDNLLLGLTRATGVEWRYGWVQR